MELVHPVSWGVIVPTLLVLAVYGVCAGMGLRMAIAPSRDRGSRILVGTLGLLGAAGLVSELLRLVQYLGVVI